LDAELKGVTEFEAAAAENEAELKRFNTPAGTAGGFPQANDERPRVEFISRRRYSSLKSFTKKDDANGRTPDEQAYRFAQWLKGMVVAPHAAQLFHGNQAAIDSCRKSLDFCKANGLEIKTSPQGENANAFGGALVPAEFDNQLIQLRE